MLSAVINWGIRRESVGGPNPCVGVQRYAIKARERFLSLAELAALRDTLSVETPTYRDFFLMCLYTGARRGNVLSMKWSEIDLDLKMWSFSSKNGDTQVVPLSEETIEVLKRRQAAAPDSPFIFPGSGSTGHLIDPKRAWMRITKRAGLKDLRIHDLRRTHGSYLAIQGESPYIIGKSLGHRDQRSTAVYARLNLQPVRDAVETMHKAWSEKTGVVSTSKAKTGKKTWVKQATPEYEPSSVNDILIEAKILSAIKSGANTKTNFIRRLVAVAI